MKYIHVYSLFLMSVFLTSCGQNQTGLPQDNIKSEAKDSTTPQKYKDSLAQASLLKVEISKEGRLERFINLHHLIMVAWPRITSIFLVNGN